MANQPTFRADPNAVPQISGWPGIVSGVQKGYALAQLPEQMKMEKMLKAAQLQKTQAEATGQENINQYYGPEAEARISSQQASTGLTNKQTSWYDKNAQSGLDRDAALTAGTRASTGLTQQQIIAARAANQENAAFQKMLNDSSPPPQPSYYQPSDDAPQSQPTPQGGPSPQMQGGAPMQGQGAPQPQPNVGQGGPMYAQQPPQGQAPVGQQPPQQGYYAPSGGPQQTASPSAPQMPQMDDKKLVDPGDPSLYKIDAKYAAYPQFRKKFEDMGYKQSTSTQINPKTGQLMTITTYPSGRQVASATQVGPGEQSQAFMENLGKQDADFYGAAVGDLNLTTKINSNLNAVKDIAEQPEFENAVGPVNAMLGKKFGLGDAKDLTGKIDVYAGQIQADMANSIKGNAAKAKLQFVQQIKPASTDVYDVFRGKLEALNTANGWLHDYSSEIAKSMRGGMSQDEAIAAADKSVPWNKYKGKMDREVSRGQLANDYKTAGIPVTYRDDGQGDSVPYVAVQHGNTPIYIPVDKYKQYVADRDKAGGY